MDRGWQEWNEIAKKQEDSYLSEWMYAAAKPEHPYHQLLSGIFASSPYLTRLSQLYPDALYSAYQYGLKEAYEMICTQLTHISHGPGSSDELMRHLRVSKGKVALIIAVADLAGKWTLEDITYSLSKFAEFCLSLTMNYLLMTAHRRGEITLPNEENPSENCSIFILGMGKLGGHELNYSSDIDLIVIFEPGNIGYKGRNNEQHFMNKLVHEMVTIMHERTSRGYVFRTDLRLRPDPSSTPPAVSTDAAYRYYESVGQNWERAAMIKARPVAGDLEAGERFLKALFPFMWRRSLDFAMINDIHSIKRQMDSLGSKEIQINGHNVKVGIGGIREIEFYVQIHQLIWGGRFPELRSKATCETLRLLREHDLIDQQIEETLLKAYHYLRKLEHRLQMVADQQTHSLPENDEGVEKIACFMGAKSRVAFEEDLVTHLYAVNEIYANSFQSSERVVNQGRLVFTGASHDPETLKTLTEMGFSNPKTVSEIVMSWHHGSHRATRTKRSRELITELMPLLLNRLSETANPDGAFLKFNDFLSHLPAGVQLFSLFNVNPHLLGLIADIMGSAPTLADHLSRAPHMMDTVLDPDFYGALPSREYLEEQLDELLTNMEEYEERMDALRYFRNEKRFQAGVQLLRSMISAEDANIYLSMLAELMIDKAMLEVKREFVKSYGMIPGSSYAVIALGKLGSEEMTFTSDIDLVFVYESPDADAVSTGTKSFSASVYYNRLSQRLLNALTGMGREGRLYEVDTRLRPLGEQGLMAISIDALEHYFDALAWTFEFMAFTKARVIYGEEDFKDNLETLILSQLRRERDDQKLRIDVDDMRRRIQNEYPSDNPWNIKFVRGGLMDIDFIVQYLVLRHGPKIPALKIGGAATAIQWLKENGDLPAEIADDLLHAYNFLVQIFNMLRLCSHKKYEESTAPQGLKKLLVACVNEESYESLRTRLIAVEQMVFKHYNALLNP